MKRLPFLLLLLVAYLTACSNRNVNPDYSSWSSIKHEFLKVMRDTSVTWQQVEDISLLVADSLKALSSDPDDLESRISAQKWAYVAFDLLNEKYEKMVSSGKDVKAEDVLNLQDVIHSATINWFYTEEYGLPLFWRDHFYLSYQESENPQEGYFHIIVSLPTEENPAPGIHIFFPDSAESHPYVIFCETVDDADPDNIKEENIINIDNFIQKDAMEEGYPLYASLGEEYVEKMFQNSAMLIGFISDTSPSGEPGQRETAYVQLNPLQDLALEYLGLVSH